MLCRQVPFPEEDRKQNCLESCIYASCCSLSSDFPIHPSTEEWMFLISIAWCWLLLSHIWSFSLESHEFSQFWMRKGIWCCSSSGLSAREKTIQELICKAEAVPWCLQRSNLQTWNNCWSVYQTWFVDFFSLQCISHYHTRLRTVSNYLKPFEIKVDRVFVRLHTYFWVVPSSPS